jgi:hypothetical protein
VLKRSGGLLGRGLAPVCVVGTVVVGLTGCTGSSDAHAPSGSPSVGSAAQTAAGASGIDLSAEVDEKLARVVLPSDRFSFDDADAALLSEAGNVQTAVCARAQGIDFVAMPLLSDIEVYRQEQFFGPWTMAQAQKFGFIEPMTDADLRANRFVPQNYGKQSTARTDVAAHNAPVVEKHRAELEACAKKSAKLTDPIRSAPRAPWHDELNAAVDPVATGTDPEVKAVLDELNDCLKKNGLKPDPERPGFVEGVDVNHITEEQIELAVQVVQCKQDVDFTQRVATIWAAREAPVLEKYAKELVAQAAANKKVVDDAQALISAHKDVFSPLP